MNIFASLGIAKRLYLVSFLLTLALMGVAAAAWMSLSQVSGLATKTNVQRVPQMMHIASVELNVTRVSLQIRHAILSRTPEELATTLVDINEKRKLIDEAVQGFEQRVSTTAGHEFVGRMRPLITTFWELGEQNIKLIQEGKRDDAFEFLVSKTIPARNQLLSLSGLEKDLQSKGLTEELDELKRHADTTRLEIVALVVVVAAGLMSFSLYISGVLRRRVGVSQAVAERVRDGDLTVPVSDNGCDEFSPLLIALADMQASLSRIVSSVRKNSESVSSSSDEIAQGNNDLSARTEQQASALEETAAAMEQASSQVNQNAENAKQASQLAQQASNVAEQGGRVVSQVVHTMRGISDSSKKIADIISVIDSIAFQTNILALNAAVEAARAGEQGRGFAVVAGEVRTLAQRSAAAAKEIKDLINDSVQRVDQGSTLVDQAGSTMQDVVSSIRRVTDIVGEISSSSNEQAQGVLQINQAISQMDQTTQQNAALVEEMAAAASSLNSQAQQLVHAVAVFQISEGSVNACGALAT